MASNNNSSSPTRPSRAETPPSQHWKRWADDATMAVNPAEWVAAPPAYIPTIQESPEIAETGAVIEPSAHESPYRILIVEDDRSQAIFAQAVLHGAGMQAIVQMDADGVQQAIIDHRPDLILMDLHMPGTDGLQLTARIRQQPQHHLLPIVFLTGDQDPERQYEALDGGADDFLSKPIRPRHLIAAVSNRIRRARQQAASLIPAGQTGPALNNPETGLPTRHHVMQQLAAALLDERAGGLFFIEIVGASGLREHYGYAAFEQLMLLSGRRLIELAQPHLLARLNDHSFLLLARGIDESSIEAFAESLRLRFSDLPFNVRDAETVVLRCVVGHARLSQGFRDAGTALEAVERTALQARQLNGGNVAYRPSEDSTTQEQLALLEGRLEIAYQPIVAVADNQSAQHQLLLRLRHSSGAVLAAGKVLPVAEATGRITDLDQQVMAHALELLQLYQHSIPPMRLFVSQSLRTMARDEFADWLLKELKTRQISGSALVVDVRLLDALVHAVTLQEFYKRLMPVGVQFCLSQFEPGTEANALLAELPLSFVRMAARFAKSHVDPGLADELRVAVDAVHQAGMQVIGQQVEDTQAAAALWMGGIDFIQGNVVQSVGDDLNFDFQSQVL